ncbi:transposase family protein [Methylovulum psychrotolerans]|nr:transposase family protein [Methylovulum psychrotolerans]
MLLTLYYLRHYPALINLWAVFGISESIARRCIRARLRRNSSFAH